MSPGRSPWEFSQHPAKERVNASLRGFPGANTVPVQLGTPADVPGGTACRVDIGTKRGWPKTQKQGQAGSGQCDPCHPSVNAVLHGPSFLEGLLLGFPASRVRWCDSLSLSLVNRELSFRLCDASGRGRTGRSCRERKSHGTLQEGRVRRCSGLWTLGGPGLGMAATGRRAQEAPESSFLPVSSSSESLGELGFPGLSRAALA